MEVDAAVMIGRASAGRALRGVWPMDDDESLGSTQVLLRPPAAAAIKANGCMIMNSNQAALSVAYCFARSEESASFLKCVKDKGWGFATRLHAKLCLWGVAADASFDMNNAQHQLSQRNLSRKVSRACITHCLYMPLLCFQIPRSKMVLSDAALLRALSIRDGSDANDFLRSFGPFVSESLYQLGGVYFSQVTVDCSEETSLLALMSQTQQELKGGFKGNLNLKLLSLGAEVSGQKKESRHRSSNESSAIKLEKRVEETSVLGPGNAMDAAEFRQKLREDPYGMAIIDKVADGRDTLVGVWDLLVQHSNSLQVQHGQLPSAINSSWGDMQDIAVKLKRAAKILCECWLEDTTRRNDILDVLLMSRRPRPSREAAECYSALIHQSRLVLANLSSEYPNQLQSKLSPPKLTPASLPDSPKDLLQALDQLVLAAEDPHKMNASTRNLSQEVANVLRYFLSESTQPAKHLSEEGLTVFHNYGFHPLHGEWESQLNLYLLKSMIQELREIPKARGRSVQEHIPTSVWGDDLNSHHMSSTASAASPSSSSSYEFQYFGDVVVDRNLLADTPASMSWGGPAAADAQVQYNFRHAAARRLIDCLRHRLNPLKHLLQAADGSSSSSSSNPTDNFDWGSDDDDQQVIDKPRSVIMEVSPFELLIQVIQGSDVSTQIAICDLLLSQRSAIPLIFPHVQQWAADGAKHDEVPLVHYMQALSFVTVNLENQQKLCVAHDTSLPRVVFISNRSVQDSHAAIVASRVLKCDFMSQHLREKMHKLTDKITVIEVGVGFIPIPTTSTAKFAVQDKSDYFACVSIQITGNYNRVMSFVGDIADVIVLELKEGNPDGQQLEAPTRSAKVLRWQETGTKASFDKTNKVLWGQETYLVQGIEKFLQDKIEAKKQLQKVSRASISEVCSRHFLPANELRSLEEPMQRMFGQCDFSDLRKKLRLQRSLVEEADAYFGGLKERHDQAKKHEKDKECHKQRDRRLKLAKDVLSIPLMKLFYHVLKQDAATPRRFGIMWLERALSEKMYSVLEDASGEVDRLFQAFNKNRKDHEARKDYYQAKQDYVDKSVGLENLWRELCHIYEADPNNQRQLTRLAAQHLLDGFPLEILDGDAGMYCKLWVESVLVELESMAKTKTATGRSARIFVLSVMGLQSSGKSTMLNLMFGTQLRTSAGRCTRGVYIQLVPSERQEYDYVLLLDTEGLRSPEFSGLEASAVRDNRLATFGLLPADASIFMVCNEDDGGLKEVLPMVLLAFKGSAIAEKCGQRIKAKMVFVYRSVDTTDKKKLKGSVQKLHEHLIEAAEEVARMGGILSWSSANFKAETAGQDGSATSERVKQEVIRSEALLSDFRVKDCEEDSDVKFLGNLKGSKPPTDTPEWSYGESVVELREYLHSRVVRDSRGWQASSFKEWFERLGLVWKCICSADFELSFVSKMQYAAYLELQAILQPPHTAVSNKYLEAFKALESRILKEDASITNQLKQISPTDLRNSVLEAGVRVVVDSQTQEVEKILDMRTAYAQWKPRELENWNRFCNSTEDWYKKRIADLFSGVLGFDKVVADYQQQFKSILVDEIERGWGSSRQISDHERESKFEFLFRKILDDAVRKHPPIAKDIRMKVTDRYNESGVGRVIGTQDGHGEPRTKADPQREIKTPWWKSKLWNSGGLQADSANERPKYPELELMIDRELRDANQYSDVIVDNVINGTREILHKSVPNLNTEEQINAHVWVKETLTNRLKDIQSKWDKNHNVAKKLESEEIRGELENFFVDLCKGLEATALLVNQLQRGLEKELKEAHRAVVVEYVAIQLGTQSWVRDWRIMRAILDYHLLTLMEMGNTDKLLMYATDGPLHFAKMMDELVGLALGRGMVEREWDTLIQKVQNCLKEEAWIKNPSMEVFLAALRRRLADSVNIKLANAVTSIHVVKSRKLDGEFYEKKLPELRKSLQKMAKPDFGQVRAALIEGVMKAMSSVPDENCRPRCEASCPECGSICYLAKGHNAGRHETIHQPAGLAGFRWFRKTALVERSCLQLLETGCFIVKEDGDRRIPFSDFEKEYPVWAMPSSNEANAVQMRESLFFHYQKELVDFWNRRRRADEKRAYGPAEVLPPEYNHPRTRLRAELHNTLRPMFADDTAWTQFTQLLRTF